jgi:hypothetical protein
VKAEQSRPIGKDPDGHIGTSKALGRALNAPLLIDQAADADFARLDGPAPRRAWIQRGEAMNKIVALVHARLDLWGTRLNMAASLLVAYMAANGAAIEKAVNSVVPSRIARSPQVAIGILTYLIVNGAAKSDAKKIGNG